jgi:hypothetical protein
MLKMNTIKNVNAITPISNSKMDQRADIEWQNIIVNKLVRNNVVLLKYLNNKIDVPVPEKAANPIKKEPSLALLFALLLSSPILFVKY